MKTLIIYDNNGKIYQTITGSYTKPNGLPFLEEVIPSDKILVSVDVKNKIPVLEDLPQSENEIIKKELAQTKLALAELAELILGGM